MALPNPMFINDAAAAARGAYAGLVPLIEWSEFVFESWVLSSLHPLSSFGLDTPKARSFEDKFGILN